MAPRVETPTIPGKRKGLRCTWPLTLGVLGTWELPELRLIGDSAVHPWSVLMDVWLEVIGKGDFSTRCGVSGGLGTGTS